MASEKNFENKVKKFLKDEGCYFIKYWGGGTFTKTGIPDLLVCCNGTFLGLEIKAENGKPSDLQLYNIRKIIEAGGIAMILYPHDFDNLKQTIRSLKKGEKL